MADILDFFEKRASKPIKHRYNLINYDIYGSSAETVLERDRIEKQIISNYIPIRPNDKVLDIGCGVGRWADEIVPLLDDGSYTGLDFSKEMLSIAEDRFANDVSAKFILGDVDRLSEIDEKFSRIHINGVMEYVDDSKMLMCLNNVNRLLADGGYLYMKEPSAVHGRFTFEGYSECLGAQYKAIYRSINEYLRTFINVFHPSDYTLIASAPSWGEPFDESKDICNMFWIIRKNVR